VQAAFRWLADSGFGGERSRGWGRAEAPEFVDGMLPEMILGAAGDRAQKDRKGPAVAEQGPAEEPSPVPPVEEPPSEEPPVTEPGPEEAPQTEAAEGSETPLAVEGSAEAESTLAPDIAAAPESGVPGPQSQGPEEAAPEAHSSAAEEAQSAEEAAQRHTPDIAGMPESLAPEPQPAVPEEAAEPSPPAEEPQPVAQDVSEPEPQIAGTPESAGTEPRRPLQGKSHWLLSLFTPAADDSVDWTRGNYTLLTRSGRVDASGELKKQLAMVAEGSVVYAPEAPRGSAPDVAPDGFAHPVFRAGFALSIPLPEVSG
jgi:hypothetical protein